MEQKGGKGFQGPEKTAFEGDRTVVCKVIQSSHLPKFIKLCALGTACFYVNTARNLKRKG